MDENEMDKLIAANHPEEDEALPVEVEADQNEAEQETTVDEPASEDEQPVDPVEEPPQEPVDSHDRAQVRAARKAERRALELAGSLKAEVARLKAEVEAIKPKSAIEVSKEMLADLESYAPEAASALKAAKELKAEKERLEAELAKVRTPAEPEFAPEVFPPDVQAKINSVPELEDWQHDPDQKNWKRAKAIDTNLATHPDWEGRSDVERFAEVVRVRKEELEKIAGKKSTQKPKPKPTVEDARRVIEETAVKTPVSVEDVRGRTPPTQITSRRMAWKNMTNEEILNSLPETS